MLITLDNISKSLGGDPILQGISLQINRGDKIGLIGANGSGKSTLLQVIHGDLEPEVGKVNRLSQLKVGFLKQIVQMPCQRTVLEEALSVFEEIHSLEKEQTNLISRIESNLQNKKVDLLLMRSGDVQAQWESLGGYTYELETKQVLFGLSFDRFSIQRKVGELSGGEQSRLNLAKLLLKKSDMLLLDEPTNHLDLNALNWLGNFLNNYSNSYLIVSHDRYFLDKTVNNIIELDRGRPEFYSGNYSTFYKEKERRLRSKEKAFQKQNAFIKKTEEFIRRNLAGQKTKQAKSRRNMLNRLQYQEKPFKSEQFIKLKLNIKRSSSNRVLTAKNLSIGYAETVLTEDINFKLHRGQRMGIIGPNGSGKTTLLKTILGKIPPVQGEVIIGKDLDFAYYHQHMLELNPQFSVLEEIRETLPALSDRDLRNHLAKFLFQGEKVFSKVSSLSGGEKSRLSLSKIFLSQANFLVLDEPSNHLDIPCREALETALLGYKGTLLLVTHDRYLLNKVTERLLILDTLSQSTFFEGRYFEWESSQSFQTSKALVSSVDCKVPNTRGHSSSDKLSKNELKRVKEKCQCLEKKIQEIESKIEFVTAKMNSTSISNDYNQLQELGLQHKKLSEKRSHLYEEWEKSLLLLEVQ